MFETKHGTVWYSILQVASATEIRMPTSCWWIIIAGTLDILLTTVMLSLGGSEANPIAAAVIESYGLIGMVVYKYFVVGLVIFGCEYVYRYQVNTARRLAGILIAIHFAPVLWSSGLLISMAT